MKALILCVFFENFSDWGKHIWSEDNPFETIFLGKQVIPFIWWKSYPALCIHFGIKITVFFWKRVEKRGFKKDADVTLKGGVYSTGYYSHRDYKHFKLGIKYVEQMEETWAFK